MIEEKVTFKSDGNILVGIKCFPKKTPAPGVILFHGLTNTKDDCPLINQTVRRLVGAGFATLKFDYFGSGESPGEMKNKSIDILSTNSKDAIEYFSDDKRVNNIGLWGRSLGGTMVCLLPPHKKVEVRVSLSAGVIMEKRFKKTFLKLKKKQKELERKGKSLPGTGRYKGKYEFGENWFKSLNGLDEKIAQNLKKISHVLVLATTPDDKVGLDNACQIINLVKDPKRICIFENTNHAYFGVEEKAIEETVKWFSYLNMS